MESETSKWKIWLDKVLVFNLFIVIAGAVFFLVSLAAKVNNYEVPFLFFQKLWFPLFIPSFSLFFSAILIEAVLGWLSRN